VRWPTISRRTRASGSTAFPAPATKPAPEEPQAQFVPAVETEVVLSLREFADSAGQLPPDFDPLVRESSGDLLSG
jgi:hypothetical protein